MHSEQEEIIICNNTKCRKTVSAKYKGKDKWRRDWLNLNKWLCHNCYTKERVGIRKELQKIMRPSVTVAIFVIFFIAATTASTTNLARAGPLEELGELLDNYNSTETATTTTTTYSVPPMQDLIDNMNNAIDREVQAQASTTESGNIIVLSHRFETDGLPKIIGEVENNSSRSYDKFDLDIVVNFRDAAGTLIVSENGFIDAETLSSGDSSAFEAISFDESLPDTASTYDVIIDDNRVVVGASLEGDDSSGKSNDDNEDEDDD